MGILKKISGYRGASAQFDEHTSPFGPRTTSLASNDPRSLNSYCH